MGIRVHEKSGASRTSLVARVLLAQLGVSSVLAALFLGLDDLTAAYSALLGGLTCVVPNAFLALRLAASHRDAGAGALVRAAYIGELGKLALTVLMFGAVFTLVEPLAAGPLFTGFIAAQVVPMVGFLMRDGDDRIVGRQVPGNPGNRQNDGIVTTSDRNGD